MYDQFVNHVGRILFLFDNHSMIWICVKYMTRWVFVVNLLSHSLAAAVRSGKNDHVHGTGSEEPQQARL